MFVNGRWKRENKQDEAWTQAEFSHFHLNPQLLIAWGFKRGRNEMKCDPSERILSVASSQSYLKHGIKWEHFPNVFFSFD
jgi:hypothetical protein